MKIRVVRSYDLDEKMVKEVMKDHNYKKVKELIEAIKTAPSANYLLDRLAVYKANQKLDFEVTE